MGLNNVLDDGQPQSGATEDATARLVHTVKPLEQSRQMFFGNAVAVIFDVDRQGAVLTHDVYFDAAAVVAVFGGIVDQIDQSLFQEG